MDNSLVHMIEIMINGMMLIVQSMDMVVQHQEDGGIIVVFTLT